MRRLHPRGTGSNAMWNWGLALLLVAGVASAQPTSSGAYLRWNLEDLPPSPAAAHSRACRAVSVSWLDARDRVLWTVALPQRMREADQGLCDCHRADDGGSCAAELREYRARPRASEPPFVIGVLREGDIVAVADASGVLLLDVRSGEVLLDWAAPAAAGARFFVDEGRFRLEGGKGCAGPVVHGHTLRRCGARLVYFNGAAVALFGLSPARLEAAASSEPAHSLSAKAGQVKARIPVGGGAFVLEGIVYLR